MTKETDQKSKGEAANDEEKVPKSGSHEDFGQTSGTDAPGGKKSKPAGKDETGATEAGNEDTGAKQ